MLQARQTPNERKLLLDKLMYRDPIMLSEQRISDHIQPQLVDLMTAE